MKKDTKDVVVGIGEIGKPIFQVLSKKFLTVGYDINPKLMNKKKFLKTKDIPVDFLHVCIPFSKKFLNVIDSLIADFNPKCVVIHSTISPYTTEKIQKKHSIPILYSATRGVHKRMLMDLKRYQKFFSVYSWAPNSKWAIKNYRNRLSKTNIKTKQLSSPLTLELAKIVVDTSYYGWLINYAQISNMIARKHRVDYDEMWSFSDEIQKYVGNRPKMFPGFIGGHCVIPNLELINESELWQIDKINNYYTKKIKDAKTIAKKYVKGKQSYDV